MIETARLHNLLLREPHVHTSGDIIDVLSSLCIDVQIQCVNPAHRQELGKCCAVIGGRADEKPWAYYVYGPDWTLCLREAVRDYVAAESPHAISGLSRVLDSETTVTSETASHDL
jgi:hypothetical protein